VKHYVSLSHYTQIYIYHYHLHSTSVKTLYIEYFKNCPIKNTNICTSSLVTITNQMSPDNDTGKQQVPLSFTYGVHMSDILNQCQTCNHLQHVRSPWNTVL